MISIVIPTLNERKYIGGLLDSIFRQEVYEEIEIVVADAGSTDGTLDVIKNYQAAHPRLSVVRGGLPAVGRNNGAKATSGDPIFFIDADLILPARSFLSDNTVYFRTHHWAISATPLTPISQRRIDHMLVGSYNVILRLSRFIRPLGAMCIVCSREAFQKSGGYPEDVIMAEDHDFVARCLKFGRYGVLPLAAEFSVRRLDKEGRWGLVWKYLMASFHNVVFGPITKPIFRYEFSYTDDEDKEHHMTNLEHSASPPFRVALYCEYYSFWKMFLQHQPMGFITSHKNQIAALARQGIDCTDNPRVQDTDILHCNAQGLWTFWLIQKFKSRGKKTVIYANATAEELVGAYRLTHFFVSLYRWYLSRLYQSADIVISATRYNQQLMEQRYGVPEAKSVVISNGVDTNKFIFDPAKRDLFRGQHGVGDSDILVLNVAAVLAKKGVAPFLTAAQRLPNMRFIWCGKQFGGAFVKKVDSQSPNMEFAGYVDDIVGAYSAADIFLFPSYEENEGIAVIEAAAIGLAIIVRDIPVYADWLEDGVNCLKAKDDDDFFVQLSLLFSDPALRRRLGMAAKEMAGQHSLAIMGEKLAGVYSRLLAV